MTFDLNNFLAWEQATRDCIDVKKIYVDMADDLVAGVLLSQIVYWFLPNKEGKTKLRVKKDDVLWLAKGRDEWWNECRIKPRQFDTSFKKLEDKKLVEKKTFKFNGDPTIHIRILWDNFLPRLQELLYLLQVESAIENEEKKEKNEIVETLDIAGFHEMVKTEIQPKTLDNTGFHESVKTGSQIGENDLSKFVKTLTENTNIDLKTTRDREEADNTASKMEDSSSLSEREEILAVEYETLQGLTEHVFGNPRSNQIDTESIWNHWHNRFPQYDLTHIYAILRGTQVSAKPSDDLTGIIISRLKGAATAIVPVKNLAIETVNSIRNKVIQSREQL
ncbi:hypothetical protein P4V47_24755 [Brevibacillus laterosporus]|uniref:hypothetical protein n=1 Tax=Brevibacillus laterosporus TaxID=1465 RepID=UPI002E235CC9|nr:hypothetical protein [Brevibacillus laterosporus]